MSDEATTGPAPRPPDEPRQGEEPTAAPPTGPGLDRVRLRSARRFGLVGVLLAVVGTGATGALGASGEQGAFTFLLLLALVAGGTGVHVGSWMLVDQWQGRAPGGRRAAWLLALFLTAFACMTAVGGVATGAAA